MNIDKETEYIEFKSSVSQMSKALESLSAMLNKHGKGCVYFNIDDKGKPIKRDISSKTLKEISNEITTRIKPTIVPTIEIKEINEISIICVTVRGNNKPYSADGKYLIRSGSENKKIDPEILRDIVFMNSQEHIVETESMNQDLSFTQLKQLYISKGLSINNKTFKKNLGLINKDTRYNDLADMLSDNNDYSIKVVRFDGKDKSNMVFRNEYGYKCLLIAMNQALDYVNSLNETKVVLDEKAVRKEIKLFDSSALREAWLNACLHTKWIKKIPPAIYIYSDRIEIVSTGGLPIDYTLNDFFSGISHPINQHLQKIMGQLGFVEQTGHGVPKIVDYYGKEAFTITDNYIIVTFKFPYEIAYKQDIKPQLSKSQLKVYTAISNDPLIKTLEICKVTNLSESRVNVIIKQLKDLGLIKRNGSKKDGYWEVIE